jgi:raffinose/stachyose/melibiose transport system permease protein
MMARAAARRYRSITTPLAGAARQIYLLVFSAIAAFPLVWVVLSSFKTNSSILGSALSLPDRLHAENYATAVSMTRVIVPFTNSIIVTAGAVALNLFLSFSAAFAIARFPGRWLRAVALIFSLGVLIPINSAILPIKLIMTRLALGDSLPGLIILYAVLGLPIGVLVLRSFLLSVPLAIDESARMDGAGWWTILFRIILPVSQSGIATVAIWQAIMAWNEFLFAILLISSEAHRTLQIAIRFFLGMFTFDYGALFAMLVMVIVPIVLVFIVFQERVIAGLTAGAIKG